MTSIDSLQLLIMSHTEQNTDFNRKSNKTLQFPQGVKGNVFTPSVILFTEEGMG